MRGAPDFHIAKQTDPSQFTFARLAAWSLDQSYHAQSLYPIERLKNALSLGTADFSDGLFAGGRYEDHRHEKPNLGSSLVRGVRRGNRLRRESDPSKRPILPEPFRGFRDRAVYTVSGL
jgi:hypothetical protein